MGRLSISMRPSSTASLAIWGFSNVTQAWPVARPSRVMPSSFATGPKASSRMIATSRGGERKGNPRTKMRAVGVLSIVLFGIGGACGSRSPSASMIPPPAGALLAATMAVLRPLDAARAGAGGERLFDVVTAPGVAPRPSSAAERRSSSSLLLPPTLSPRSRSSSLSCGTVIEAMSRRERPAAWKNACASASSAASSSSALSLSLAAVVACRITVPASNPAPLAAGARRTHMCECWKCMNG